MISQFARYYKGTLDKRELFEAILEYDFQDYEDTLRAISVMKRVARRLCSHSILYSNGSSGDALGQYTFGPDFGYWCPHVEWVLRDYQTQVRIAHGNRDTDSCCYVRPLVASKNGLTSIFLDLSDDRNLADLSRIVARIANETGRQVNLCGKPNTWLLLGTDPAVRDGFLAMYPYLDSLINEDWEPWLHPSVSQNFFFNDQMIDWKTGINFYTCRRGTKHFLPLFWTDGKSADNLLNLTMGPVAMSDRWQVSGSRRLCECGKYYLPATCQSHARFNLDIPRNLINGLRSGYLNLQFLRQGDSTKVLYSCSTSGFADEDYIRSCVGDEAEFVEGGQFYVGRKKYNFWRDDRPIDVQKWCRPRREGVGCL